MYLRASLFFLLSLSVAAQNDNTALGALKLLPKDAPKHLARIEARDGAPAPERWHFLVHDPDSPRGVREFVVAGGKVVATRTLSQFADFLKPADVLPRDSVRYNSDQVARLAALFAAANGGRLGSLNYELMKTPADAEPIWRATVLDPQGDQIGVLVINAARGIVVSHDGFEKAPAPAVAVVRPSGSQKLPPIHADEPQVPPEAARVPTPASPTPKRGLWSRIFGKDPDKSPKVPQ